MRLGKSWSRARNSLGLLVALCAPPEVAEKFAGRGGVAARTGAAELGLVAAVQAAAAVVAAARVALAARHSPLPLLLRPPVRGRHVLHGRLRRGQDARGLARRADEDGERRPFGRHRKTRLDGRKARLTCCRRSRYERTEGGRSTSIELAARTGRNIHKRISNSFRFLRRPCVGGASSQIERRARPGWAPRSRRTSRAPRLARVWALS